MLHFCGFTGECVCTRMCVHMTVHICMFMYIYVIWVCVHLSNEAHTAEFLVHRYSCLFYHCAQTHGFLPRKQSPAHSVAFCSILELGETKAACWLHSKPTGTGCFPPEEGGVHTLNQKQTRGSHPGHLTELPEERHLARQVTPKHLKIKPELKGYSCPLWNLQGFREGTWSTDHRLI